MIRLRREKSVVVGSGTPDAMLQLVTSMVAELGSGVILIRGSGADFRLDSEGVADLRADLRNLSYDDLDDLELTALDSQSESLVMLGARMSKGAAGWRVTCQAEATSVGAADAGLARLEQLVNDFGGPEAEVSTDIENVHRPRRIERSHEPEVWKTWAITRQDFGRLIDEVAGLLNTAGAEETNCSLSVPGFDDRFASSGEFLLNVNEQVWADRHSAILFARCRSGRLDGLSLTLALSNNSVDLTLSGATRADRNAVLPDLRGLVSRYERGPTDFGWWRSMRRGPYAILVVLSTAGATVAAVADGIGGLLIAFLVISSLAIPGLLVVYKLEDLTDRARPNVEFLPDSGESRWTELLQRTEQIGKRLLALIGVLGTLTAILKAFGAI